MQTQPGSHLQYTGLTNQCPLEDDALGVAYPLGKKGSGRVLTHFVQGGLASQSLTWSSGGNPQSHEHQDFLDQEPGIPKL